MRSILARLLACCLPALLAACGGAAVTTGATPAAVAQSAGWAGVRAVKAHRVPPIDDDLVSRPGPRLADGLAAMAKLIHPEQVQGAA